MSAPTIHLNGSSPESLLEDYENALGAVGDALRALSRTAPNGRDYYPQGAQALVDAQKEHVARVEALSRVATELEALAWHVQDAIDEREARKAGQR